ncbi:RDD family protein [Flammeovirga sp. OC4]|uniref:RDD family protein n=1 Tax=Flammeovirga sp. OC4 TaxID=1382345 RepID=UPI0009E2F13D|nr:RDD family protein [Flammeovirga sp. OC4]
MSSISFQNSQNVNLQFQKALITTRIAAFLIDILLLSSILLFPFFIFTMFDLFIVITIWVSIMSFVILVYNLLCEIFFEGQSLGKRAMKIRVVSMDGESVKLSQFFIRWIFRFVDILLMQGAVAVFTILIRGKGQRLGDILAGTMVISERRKVEAFNFSIPEFAEDYAPMFLHADAINDQQLNVIKKTLKFKGSEEHEEVVHTIANKLKEQLSVESSLEDIDFIEQLLNDYYFLTLQSQKNLNF